MINPMFGYTNVAISMSDNIVIIVIYVFQIHWGTDISQHTDRFNAETLLVAINSLAPNS